LNLYTDLKIFLFMFFIINVILLANHGAL